MKKLTTFLLSGVLLFGAAACSDGSKTAADAPNTTEATPTAPEADAAKDAQADAQSQVRRDQLNSDIRATEQRNNALNDGKAENRDDDAIATEVRSKLEANLPASQLVVDGEDNGVVVVSGTVPTKQQFDKIEKLAKEIKGVKTVQNKATVAAAKPEDSNKKAQ
jgi:hyperosmotically inducible periplasmic protein